MHIVNIQYSFGKQSQGSVRKAQDLANMRDDLSVKEGEVHRSRSTASGLAGGM